jgi:hypothetical protein
MLPTTRLQLTRVIVVTPVRCGGAAAAPTVRAAVEFVRVSKQSQPCDVETLIFDRR